MHHSAAELLGENGPFARDMPGFAPREVQQQLASAVENAIADSQVLIAEAGTGTGKTFAYLVPALRSGKRVIVSTGTKTLQDQLFHRDLPHVRTALGTRLKASLLKGRANYVCRYRLEQASKDGKLTSRAQVHELSLIRAFAGRSGSGDIMELAEVAEDSSVWPLVTSTADNCLGSECPMFNDCFVVKARRAAQEADLVVVNHHLLFADLAIKREGFGEILPGAHAFILDEAHQLPELAGQFFSIAVSARQLTELAHDSEVEAGLVSAGLAEVIGPAQALELAVKKVRLALEPLPSRGAYLVLRDAVDVQLALSGLRDALSALNMPLAVLSERSPGLESCAARGADLADRLSTVTAPQDAAYVHWYELSGRGFALYATPLDIAAPMRELRAATQAAWIFTSATLSVAGHFEHFARQLGLDEPTELCLSSPFDYARNALCYLPQGLPEPSAKDYTERVIDVVLPILESSQGRAFLLFTSHRALKLAAQILPTRCNYPLFVQGTVQRHQLLTEFRRSGNGVLLGAASFWEGVDVVGEALSLVVIDKLPFAAPDDPVLEARLAAVRDAGGNPFPEWQIPSAVIALKQGAGRLIRAVDDRGVLVLCDPRLTTRGYGRVFLKSLPEMPRTRNLADVEHFFAVAAR